MDDFTLLTRRNQETALEILIENNLIECEVFVIPAKKYFRIKERK